MNPRIAGAALMAVAAVGAVAFQGLAGVGRGWSREPAPSSAPSPGAGRAIDRTPVLDDPVVGPDREASPSPAPTPSSAASPTAEPPALGELVGVLRWLGHEQVVVEGTGLDQLRLGPGRYRRTSMPGAGSNVAVAGHRTTHGAPFGNLDRLEEGDEITLETDRLHVYEVAKVAVVEPGDLWVIGDDPLGVERSTLTLTTCHPKGSARQRLVVWAVETSR